MRDELFDRDYLNSRESLNASIDRAVAAFARRLWHGFSRLHELQWHAPWRGAPQRHRRGRTGLA
jgi:hypothetical protein